MTELEWHKAFIDWCAQRGKISDRDIEKFSQWMQHRTEAKRFVDENFKGMF